MDQLIKEIFNNQLELQNHIGIENNAEVYEGKYNNNSKILNVLVKMISRNDIKQLEQVLIEVGFLKYLSGYKTSLKFINICYNIKLTPQYLILILEKPQGVPLSYFMNQDNIRNMKFTDYYHLIMVIMYRLLLAINYIHTKGVSHRNLNPDTIYVDYQDGLIENIKITDFGISCGKYISVKNDFNMDIIQSTNQTNQKIEKKTKKGKNIYNKICDTIDLEIDPPEKLSIPKLIQKIKRLSKNQTRDSIHLYLAKKTDIWSLGMLYWKLINKQNLNDNPLNQQFPKNYKTNHSWKTYKGYKEGSRFIQKIFSQVIEMMLSEIPERGKSDEILDKFIITNKYFEEKINNNDK